MNDSTTLVEEGKKKEVLPLDDEPIELCVFKYLRICFIEQCRSEEQNESLGNSQNRKAPLSNENENDNETKVGKDGSIQIQLAEILNVHGNFMSLFVFDF